MAKRQNKSPRKRTVQVGWLTTDADEIERRRMRGVKEPLQVEQLTRDHEVFADFRVHSHDDASYRVEIRSLDEPLNSCDCPDHRINGLGTCKHIEATLHWLHERRGPATRKATRQGSPWMEVFLDRRDHQVRARIPRTGGRRNKARALLDRHFTDDGTLRGAPLDALPPLLRALEAMPPVSRRKIRISVELHGWLAELDRREQLVRRRRHFETEIATGGADLDLVKRPLYPYQQEGMLHLALTGRALLADEMGLGKTVQAVAACELLRRLAGIRHVLVVSPASLKGEWQEQITKFTDLPSRIVQGPRSERLRQYAAPVFFHLASYEQVRADVAEINGGLAPDVVILDEAQRIKNWKTRTADAVKQLQSPYAFVLTGTPIENRIDEIYSIGQFLDARLFGPLFRFNREFYRLDEKGRPVGYRNLDRLHARLRGVMLRRRKDEVEGELPGRTVNTYFVPMHKEQWLRYREYEATVARIAALAKKRPLKKEEMERLQQNLACMRMLCDTPYILDRECRISPKLEELVRIIGELLEDGDHKILVFSEWERMLELVGEQATKLGLDHAWHTGRVPQPKRRAAIRRFKHDPGCRLFLSTDSGSVGLNLQVADVVINLDMPWNPAKLEQRIARAWRKHQKRSVQVINLVAEQTLEHRMLSLLEQKRTLAEGVVDGRGRSEMALPSGRAAFLDRLDSLLDTAEPAVAPRSADPLERLRDTLLERWGGRLRRLELHGEGGGQTLLVVVERDADALRIPLEEEVRNGLGKKARLQVLDQATYAAIQQMIENGILSANSANARTLHAIENDTEPNEAARRAARLEAARSRLAASERPYRMARLLVDGGFAREALAPLRDALDAALGGLLLWQGHESEASPDLEQIETQLVPHGLIPREDLDLLTWLRECGSTPDETEAAARAARANDIFTRITVRFESMT